jgi:Uma2 family endonuclease
MGRLSLEDLPHYTITEYKGWEGDWELIYGVPYAMSPAPVNKHQLLNGKIFRQLDESLDECNECLAIIEADWILSDETVFRPDTAVICYEPEDYLTKAPEIIFEVISSSTAKRDEIIKFQAYAEEGVSYYCLIYPDMLLAKLYKLHDGRYIKVGDFDKETYVFETKECKLKFDFSMIFKLFKK